MTRALLLALALMPAAARAEEPASFRERLAWYAVPASADALSTSWALDRGGVEGNPFLRQRGLAIGLQAASVPFLAWLDGRLERRAPGLQWVLRGLRLAVSALAVWQNMRAGNLSRAP